MNNLMYVLCLIMLVVSCVKKEKVDLESIKILVKNQHLFLIDHGKELVILNSKGKIIDSESLHDNVDGECKTFLFEDQNNFIIIDCDGKWYYVKKQTGEIQFDENYNPFEKKDLPENYIGTFIYKENSYNLMKDNKTIDINEVYKYGGG